MATYKVFEGSSLFPDDSCLKCDLCGSVNIRDTISGYVCRECGIELDLQRLEYHRPYQEEMLQYAKGLGHTQLGTRRERLISPHSRRLDRLNKYNRMVDTEKAVIETARQAISTLFSALDLSEYESIKELVLTKFKAVRKEFMPGSRYRNVDTMVAVLSYLCLKIRKISIHHRDIIDASGIPKKTFHHFLLQVQKYVPEYGHRNRNEYILQRVLEVCEHFDLGMEFYHLAKKVLQRLWNEIQETTDDVIAGLICSITVLCAYKDKVTVNGVCKMLGVMMSTIQSQVKRKIFEQFGVVGFISLVKSSGELTTILEKLGLLESTSEEHITSDIISITLGNAPDIFTHHDHFEIFCLAFKGGDQALQLVFLKVRCSLDNSDSPDTTSLDPLMNFELLRYYPAKGPPLIMQT